MIYGSVCSGIEAATVAWHPLGWRPAFFSEIDKFPRAVLQHHYPDVPLHGDFTTIQKGDYAAIDLLVGGTPCQSFSVAGLRKGLDDPRGNLMLEFGALAKRLAPRWIVWENVPGVLSSNGGRDFGAFLGMLGELGYGFAYRVLDAQFFGVAQRRRRVFVIGCLGDWRAAAAVLFDAESLRGHPAPSREKGEDAAISPCLRAKANSSHRADSQAYVAGTITAHAFSGGAGGRPEGAAAGHFIASTGDVSHCLNAGGMGRQDYETETMVVHGTQDPCVSDVAFAQGRNNGGENVVCRPIAWSEELTPSVDVAGTIQRGGAGGRHDGVFHAMQVRRLTPRECERLQGFPDDYTAITSADGPRYKALGNSMAVPVMNWIGSRIAQVDAITRSRDAVAA